MSFLKKCSLIIYILFVVLLTSSCAKSDNEDFSDKPVIRIAYLPITHSIPLLVQNELEKELDSQYRIELVKFAAWSELLDALNQNIVDGASILFEVALKLSGDSQDLKLFSLSHRDGNVMVSSDDIESFQDLKGKTIAIPHRLSPHNTLLHIILEQENMSIDDVRVVELAPAEMPSSLMTGAISAFIVAEPYGSISVSSGIGKILFNSDDFHGHSVCCTLVFNSEFLANNTDIMHEFFENFEKASERSHNKDDFVVQIYRDHINIKENVIAYSLEHISFDNLIMSEEEYREITELILRYNILDSVPEYDQVMYEMP